MATKKQNLKETRGGFHSTRNSGTLQTEANSTEIFLKKFQENPKNFIFRDASHSTEFFENLGIPSEVVHFYGDSGNRPSL